jgi:hypothetical protein
MMKQSTNPEEVTLSCGKPEIPALNLKDHLEKESIWLKQGAAICSFD